MCNKCDSKKEPYFICMDSIVAVYCIVFGKSVVGNMCNHFPRDHLVA